MDKRLRDDLIVLCFGLAGLAVGQVLSDRLTTRSPQSPSAISAARLASAMALARRMHRLLPRRQPSVSADAVVAFVSATTTVLAAPVVSRLVQGKASKPRSSASARGRG